MLYVQKHPPPFFIMLFIHFYRLHNLFKKRQKLLFCSKKKLAAMIFYGPISMLILFTLIFNNQDLKMQQLFYRPSHLRTILMQLQPLWIRWQTLSGRTLTYCWRSLILHGTGFLNKNRKRFLKVHWMDKQPF